MRHDSISLGDHVFDRYMELREHGGVPDDELLEVGEAYGFAVETEIGVKQDAWFIERLVVDGIEQAANDFLVLFGRHASSSPPLNRPSPQSWSLALVNHAT